MTTRRRNACLGLLAAIVGLPLPAAIGDEFDRLDGGVLTTLLRDTKTRTTRSLGFRDMEALPAILRDSRSPLIVVKTDEGNPARLLIAPGFHKRKDAKGGLVPVLVIERFETFEGGGGARVARGRDLTLFPGFRLDLDSGRIVPEGLGGDLLFTARGEDDGSLAPIEPALLAIPESRPGPPATAAAGPSAGKVVVPSDFAGKYRLVADGQWSGELTLQVEPAGAVSGSFLSDGTGSESPVSGKVEADGRPVVSFSIQFPRARQDFTGRLWSDGKNVLAGLFTMGHHESSFVAVREGANAPSDLHLELAPGVAVEGSPPQAEAKNHTWIRVAIEADSDRYRVRTDPTGKTAAELSDLLKQAVSREPGCRVVLAVPPSTPYSRVLAATEAIRAAGIASIRIMPATEGP
ncbi:ExbD/TolR family protein [Aquisphaera insulae]|uniref:ExbD/TolR family protein n=1 Tax=Aquisphaera insulae TaxID=2712864 RepID=UPI0013EB2D7A|nr:biopolymer transporter ExbD [Aquisphaera insulae]